MTLPSYSQAVSSAHVHQDSAGDDVVLHDFEDYDGYLVCEDCDWGLSYEREADDLQDESPGSTEKCHAAKDGDCVAATCPQLRDGEPAASGRHCPIDTWTDEERGI